MNKELFKYVGSRVMGKDKRLGTVVDAPVPSRWKIRWDDGSFSWVHPDEVGLL